MQDRHGALIGTTIAGRYELLSVLGEGGMGVVFRARQIALNYVDDRATVRPEQGDRQVAVKLLHANLDNPNAVTRFEREMRASARIEHPNTVRVYDYGESDGRLFLVMELIAGRSLAKVLLEDAGGASGPGLPGERVLKLAIQIGKALIAAHAEGVVHRDLKPDNVMVLDIAGERDFVKVVDFGIARFVETSEAPQAQLTAEGAVIGTPAYMSPEQVQGTPPDLRTDLYSFGIVLFEMVTGRAPFEAPTTLSLIVKHVKDAPPRPSELAPSVPPLLEALILQCLEKDPAARPRDAAEVVRRLDALQRMTTTVEHTPNQKTRNSLPWVLGGVAVAVALLAAAAVWLLGRGDAAATDVIVSEKVAVETIGLASTAGAEPAPLDAQLAAPGTAMVAPGADPRAALAEVLVELGLPDVPSSCMTRDSGQLEILAKAGRLMAGGDDAAALALLTRYRDLLAQSAEGQALTARATLHAVQPPSEALAPAKAAVARCDSAMAFETLGDVYRASEQSDDARTAYITANTREPERWAPLEKAAQIGLDREQWEDVVRILDNYARVHPEHGPVRRMLAEAYIALGDAPRAASELEIAAKAAPDDGRTQWLIGRAQTMLGHLAAADRANANAKRLGFKDESTRHGE